MKKLVLTYFYDENGEEVTLKAKFSDSMTVFVYEGYSELECLYKFLEDELFVKIERRYGYAEA